jgi:hypothetical protein
VWLPSVYCTVTFDRVAAGAAQRIASVEERSPPLRGNGRTAECRGPPRGRAVPGNRGEHSHDGRKGQESPPSHRAQEGSSAASGPAISS